MTVRKIEGKWIVDFRFHHAGGKTERVRRLAPVQSKGAATEYERQLRTDMLSPSNVNKEVPTFATFADDFMKTYAVANNKPSEQDAKRKNLRLYLLPALGRTRLDAISTHDIEALKAKLLTKSLGAKTINNALTCLGKILRYAEEGGILAKVPRIKLMRLPPQSYDFLSDDELDRLLNAAKSDPHRYAMVVVAAFAGLRRGEIIGLEWGDVDFHAGTLTVRRAVWKTHVGSPKGGRERKLPMSNKLTAALQAIRHVKGDRIFYKANGELLRSPAMGSALRYLCKLAGFRPIGWHVLRHTFCSHLAKRGAAPKAVQELAGHTDLRQTLRYMHLAPSELREAIGLLDQQVGQRVGGVEIAPGRVMNDVTALLRWSRGGSNP